MLSPYIKVLYAGGKMKYNYVYIAGPYTSGSPSANTRKAIKIADDIWELGFVPFVPHLSLLWDFVADRKYEEWLDYDFKWIKRCDVLYRMEGKSPGADAEIEFANANNIPVVHSIAELLILAREWNDGSD
jgi:hypothetical protein